MQLAHEVRPSSRSITDDLAERGWAVVPNFLPASDVAAVGVEARLLWQDDAFRRACVGRGTARQLRPEIRTDHVLWLEASEATPAQEPFFERMEALRQQVNESLFLGLFAFEAHLALYPAGAFYRRHLDAFAGTRDRVLTAVLYLNQDWSGQDGGALRLYVPDEDGTESSVDVLPRAGTLVLFLAGHFEHEVLPARRERMSVTGWFLRR